MEKGIAPEKIIVGGFSQGGAIALFGFVVVIVVILEWVSLFWWSQELISSPFLLSPLLLFHSPFSPLPPSQVFARKI